MVLIIYFFLLGAIIGSFINALSYRMPKNISIIKPRSRCPKCGHQLTWQENIPLLSFLIQNGRCFYCKTNIPIRYLLIEILFCLVFGLSFYQFQYLTSNFFFFLICFTTFSLITIIDLENKIIPDSLNIFLAILLPLYLKSYLQYKTMIIGGLCGFLSPLLVTFLYYKFTGKIGLGGGDIKLYGVVGLTLGAPAFIINIFLSCTLGSIVIILLIVFKIVDKNDPIPFGPFILVVFFLQIFSPSTIGQLLNTVF